MDTMTPEEIEDLIGSVPEQPRGYVAKTRCPHIKRDGEQCRSGVMAGSTKCAGHSGLTGRAQRSAHKTAQLMASPEAQTLILAALRDGEEITDPGQLLRRAASALQKVTEHFGARLGDGTVDIDDLDLQRWLAVFDRLTKLCTDLVKLGILEKAVDASEIVFRREYQELAAQILDDLEDFPEARLHLAERMHSREAARAGL